MIYINGVKPDDKRRVAHAIVTALGIAGVCTQEPKCQHMGGGRCSECAATKFITFIFDERRTDK